MNMVTAAAGLLNEGKLLTGENAPHSVQTDKGMPRHALCLLRPV